MKELEQHNKLLEDNLARTESSAAAAAEDAARRGVCSNPAGEEGRTRRAGDSAADGGGAATSVDNGDTIGELGTLRGKVLVFRGVDLVMGARSRASPEIPSSSKP